MLNLAHKQTLIKSDKIGSDGQKAITNSQKTMQASRRSMDLSIKVSEVFEDQTLQTARHRD